MHPVLLDTWFLGTRIVLDAYPTLILAGAVLGLGVAFALIRRRGLPTLRSSLVLLTAAVAVPLGGRLLFVVTEMPLFRSSLAPAFAPDFASFALYGGMTAAVVTAVIAARLASVDLWRLADAAAPGVALSIVLAKSGCFCEGCCHGVVTAGPLGIVFPLGSQAHGAQMMDGVTGVLGPVLPVMPTQLMEMAGAAVFGMLALWLAKRAPHGVAFLAFAGGFSAARLVVRPLRWIEPSFTGPGWFYPALYVGIIATCCALAVWRFNSARAESPGPVPDAGWPAPSPASG
ncbi:MAG: hypothetical protein CVT67_10360 [Actinobacteria bacterium HGW-Actinobacteria-7]|jgi:phosphatidylglycerol:prolipoprotein diacylglycerol transferase|nr:MAG: hypothetical protein CVT67_10360 [Actinobacteria bacterium HGW-Actinobacteria-7]